MKIQTTVLCLVLMMVSRASAQEWRTIAPLTSTRADAERLLGPNSKSSYGVDYDLNDGILSIEYSSGPCTKERKGGWNVAEGVVISLNFSPKRKQRESELKLNRRKFRRVVDTHTGRNIYYINDKDGIMYEIQQGLVDSIEYFPRKRYDNLYCEKTYELEIGQLFRFNRGCGNRVVSSAVQGGRPACPLARYLH